MAYKIYVESKLDGSLDETDGEIYDSKEAAEDALDDVINSFRTGAEVLELSGRNFSDPDDYIFKIKKI